ncbi:MAG: hypothetical protein ACXU9U_04575 [Parachlamydiaceae bacterium]
MLQKYFPNKLLCFLLLIFIGFASARLYYWLTDDFRLANISYPMPFHPEWEPPPLSNTEKTQLDQILNQPFTYIGKGVQSYAFSSADNLYVLKFFKFKHLTPSPLLDWLPNWEAFNHYRLQKRGRKEAKFEGVFGGYYLAYTKHKEGSGLLFIHLNLTENELPSVKLVDKIGRTHIVDLDRVPFLVQIKAETMRTVLHKLLEKGDIEQAKARISEIFDLYFSEYQKGLYDHDHGIMHNAGFAGNKPIHLDVGKLKQEEAMCTLPYYSEDIILVARRMAKWLKAKEPQDYPELAKHIEMKISSIIQRPFQL